MTTLAKGMMSQTSNSGGGLAATNTNSITAGIASTQRLETENVDLNSAPANTQSNSNNTISAAADSSDNKSSPPQPPNHTSNIQSPQHSVNAQHTYANHNIYGSADQSTAPSNLMYAQHIYAQHNMDSPHQQLQPNLTPTQQNASYPSFLNSYQQFYQQQQQNTGEAPHQLDFTNSNTQPIFSSTTPSAESGVRYHPYGHNSTSGITVLSSQNSNSNNALDANSQAAPVVSAASSSVMSPRVVSSTSPSSSNQMQVSGSASSISNMSIGNPSSPNSTGTPQCKKCGVMVANESELQEHITNVHGASPYGSSGYASSPYIKEEMQQQTPPSQNQQQATAAQQSSVQGVNPGEILDLDSQKLLYPTAANTMPAMMHANLGNANDPLHGLHSMQQRAGINTWDQQSQEGLPPYLQQQPNSDPKNISEHSTFYHPTKQSPYHNTNTSNIIKTEYQPIVKTEYTGDSQQYIDDATAANQQQQMMPPAVSSSPAERPSTTTGGPQDNQQQNVSSNPQFRGGNFEPPSSSSATVSTGPIGTKAANWKSNEARRPKTYNCTACTKWFTSSGHLKRHYNTTLHKNAVKSSGKPDPATLPISAHHHPARDPTGKTGRGRGVNAAANAPNNNGQQQQQPPNPVQPPEPPNSPQGYVGSQVAAAGLPPLSPYTATSSPTSMFEHHHYAQHQYVAQVQSTTSASPQHVTSMSNHNLLQNQQQQPVLNGHPNALAGLSVPTTVCQHQTLVPSSQMRGLLNTTTPLSTATKPIYITKIEHLGAAPMGGQHQAHEKEAEEFDYLTKLHAKQVYLEEMEEKDQYQGGNTMYPPKVDQQGLEKPQIQQLVASPQIQHYQQDPAQQEGMDHFYHNTNSTHSSTPVPLQTIISHQLYPEQQQQEQVQTLDQATYTHMGTPPLQQQQQHNTTDQHYINMHLVTNMPPINMLQLQPQLTTMEQQQLPPATTIPTNTVSIQPLNHHHHHMQPPPLQHMEPQPQANMSLQLATINTNTPSHTTTTNSINIPLYHQQQHPDSVPPQLEHTPTYPPTIIGNTEVVTIVPNSNLQQQVTLTPEGTFMHILPIYRSATAKAGEIQCYSQHMSDAGKSPLAGDLPPMPLFYDVVPLTTQPSSNCCSPTQDHTNATQVEYFGQQAGEQLTVTHYDEQAEVSTASPKKTTLDSKTTCSKKTASNKKTAANKKPTPRARTPRNSAPATKIKPTNKRTRNSSSSSSSSSRSGDAISVVLPNGRIKCLSCNKDFTKPCYFTQHNNSFHAGECPYRCPHCGKRYNTGRVYVYHVKKHVTEDKDHKCEQCPKQFHYKTDLTRHIDAIHTGNKKHSCPICQKSFCRNDHLRKHIETHNRKKVVAKKKPARAKTAAAPPRKKKPKNSPDPAPEASQNESMAGIANLDTDNFPDSTTSPPLQQIEKMAVESTELLANGLQLYGDQDITYLTAQYLDDESYRAMEM